MEWPWIYSWFWVFGKVSPRATLICHSTRSYRVIISVIGCSTCNLGCNHRKLPCVHLHKVEFFKCLIDNELDRACIVIAHSFSCFDGCFADFLTKLLRNQRRRFFDDLLMASLNRTISLKQVNIVKVMIPENLDFYVLGLLDILFHQNTIVFERF
jgi:hypothetical protein